MTLKSKKRKILRWTSGVLLVILVLMVMIGWWGIDIKKNPLLFIWYFTGAILLALAILVITFLEIWEIQKTLKKSLMDDQAFLIGMIKKAVELEVEQAKENQQKVEENSKN